MSNTWYAINAAKGSDAAEVSIYDEIGAWGVTAKSFVDALKAIDAKTINLRLNTPGGEVTEANAIYNALMEHPARIVVHVDGLAASAGSYIAMAGDEVRMADNAWMMIHNAQGGVMGEAADMRKYADVLEKMSANVAAIYEKKTGVSADHWRELMNAETWMTAEEAVDEGLADTVYAAGGKKAGASASASAFKAYNKIPDAVRAMWGLTPPAPPAVQPKPENAPEASPPLGGATPAITEETPHMAVETPQAVPAQNPAAVATPSNSQGNTDPVAEIAQLQKITAQGHYNNGHTKGVDDGDKRAVERLKAIMAVCPNNPAMALEAFLGGQTPEAAKLAFDAVARAEARAKEQQDVQAREIARLNALAALGGIPGGLNMGDLQSSDEPEAEAVADPKAKAEQEWDYRPAVRKGFTSRERYVAVRTAELNGQFRQQTAGGRA